MELNQGILSGLAQDFGSESRLQDLRYQNHLYKQAQAESAAKAQMFSDDLDFQNAANAYDNPRIKEFAKNKIKEIGSFVRENPDWQYNPDKLMQIKLMKRDLKDNPELIRGVASDNAFKQLNADLAEVAKAPEQHDVDAYEELDKQRQNYLQYGNQFGPEAFAKQGAQPFVYTKPKNFVNLPKALQELGSSIKNYNVEKGKTPGEWWSTPKQEDVQAVKQAAYQEHKRQIEVEAKRLGMTDPAQIDKWVSDQIASGFQKHYDAGDVNALWNRGMQLRALAEKQGGGQKPASYTPWDDLFDPRKPAGNVPTELVRKVWNDNPKIQISGIGGVKVDLTGHQMNYDGRYVTNAQGQRFLTGYVNLPLEVAKEKGIYNDEADEDTPNLRIKGPFLGKARVQKKEDKDGVVTEYVRVDYPLPIDPHDGTGRQMYNAIAQPDKLSQPLEYDQLGNQQEGTYQGFKVGAVVKNKAGNKFLVTANGLIPQ
jgi:hypothetical protein